MLKFEILKNIKTSNIKIIYNLKEETFDYEPLISTDTSILIAYLSLCIDSKDMLAKALWGLSPIKSWKNIQLIIPQTVNGSLKLISEFEPGSSYRIDDFFSMWESYYDKKSNWFCIGNPITDKEDNSVKIAKNMIITIDNDSNLKTVWINPEFV